jgi:hypothetical protein
MDTFADSPRSLQGLEFAQLPKTPFALRYDWQATQEGQRGGMSFQSTEWQGISADTWEQAKIKARALVSAIPAIRFDSNEPHHLRGCCLVELVAELSSFRTLVLSPN